MKWPEVYKDEILQQLIKEALTNNYNVRIAATAIMQAQANLGITRANQFPSLAGSFAIQNERNSAYPGAPTFDTAGLSFSYIVDFWGQYRRATESARATLLSTKYAQDVVRVTLIDSVAAGYFALRGFDAQLDISQQTAEADREIVRINTIGFKGGEYAITDVYQAQMLVQTAEAQIITLQQSIEQTENQLSILLGRNPGPIVRGLTLWISLICPNFPQGCRRHCCSAVPTCNRKRTLVAANANVGVAKANFFPQISLTGYLWRAEHCVDQFSPGTSDVLGSGRQESFNHSLRRQDPVATSLAWAQRDQAELTLQANRAAGFRGCFQQPRWL